MTIYLAAQLIAHNGVLNFRDAQRLMQFYGYEGQCRTSPGSRHQTTRRVDTDTVRRALRELKDEGLADRKEDLIVCRDIADLADWVADKLEHEADLDNERLNRGRKVWER